MYTHVVLLRGVNVGKAKRVPMADFKALLLALGCNEVQTLLNSGNAVVAMPKVSAATLSDETAAALHDKFGFDVPVVVKSIADFRAIFAGNGLVSESSDPSRVLVAFAQTATTLKGLAEISKIVRPPDQFLMGKKAAYLTCPNGILKSSAAIALLGKAGQAVTTRNWATVLKLHDAATVPRI